jgi:hypothetical protein
MIIGNPIVIGGGGSSDGVAEGLFHAVYSAFDRDERNLSDSQSHPVTEVPMETFMSGRMEAVRFDSCVTVGKSAFAGCTSLRNASFASCVTVGECAFYGDDQLTVYFRNLENVGSSAFMGTSLYMNGGDSYDSMFSKLRYVGDDAFNGALTSAHYSFNALMPDLESVGSGAFVGMDRMCVSLDLGKVTSENGAFGISSGSSYVFPYLESVAMSCVTTVPAYLFCDAGKLGTADIRACVTVEDCAFYGCHSLSAVSAGSVRTVGDSAFEDCFSLSDFSPFSMVESVGYQAFAIDPSTAATKSSAASAGYTYAETVMNLPRLSQVGYRAFRGRSFAVVSLPSLQELGELAFEECTIVSLYLMGPSVPSIGSSAFYQATGPETVYVPSSLYDAYMDTSLSDFNVVGV